MLFDVVVDILCVFTSEADEFVCCLVSLLTSYVYSLLKLMSLYDV